MPQVTNGYQIIGAGFRIECKGEVSMPAVRASLIAVLSALVLLAAAPAADAGQRKVPNGFYGVMWDRAASEAPAADQRAQWDLMARSGVESVRTAFSWRVAQPVGGRPPSFALTDQTVELASQRNIRVLPVVSDTPRWAAIGGRIGAPPARIADYVAYLDALVRRYGPQGTFWAERPDIPRRPLREWQIWNEPHLDGYWRADGDDIWAQGYAALLQASNAALERADPGSVTVLAGLADFVWLHMRKLYRAGIRGHFDVAAMNFFTTRPRLVMKGVRLFRAADEEGGRPAQAGLAHRDHLAGLQGPRRQAPARLAARVGDQRRRRRPSPDPVLQAGGGALGAASGSDACTGTRGRRPSASRISSTIRASCAGARAATKPGPRCGPTRAAPAVTRAAASLPPATAAEQARMP